MINLSTVAPTAISTAWTLGVGIKSLVPNIYNGDQDGQGPYSNVAKRAFQAALQGITAIAMVTAISGIIQMMPSTDATVDIPVFNNSTFNGTYPLGGPQVPMGGDGQDTVIQDLIQNLIEGILAQLPIEVTVGTAKKAIATAIVAIGGTSSILNIIRGDSDNFSKPYATVTKRTFQSLIIGLTALSLRSLYQLNPELANTGLAMAASYGWSGLKSAVLTAADLTTRATGTALKVTQYLYTNWM